MKVIVRGDLLALFGNTLSFVVATGSVLLFGHLISRRHFEKDGLTVHLVGMGIYSAGILVALSLTLLFLHLYVKEIVVLVSVALAVLAWRVWREYFAVGSAFFGTVRAIREVATGVPAVILAFGGFALIVQICRGLLNPPLAWDSLTYHLTLASLWVRSGGYDRLLAPDVWIDYSHFPANGELFLAWLMLPFHDDLLVSASNLPFILLGALAVYGISRELGAQVGPSILAAALVALSPPTFAYVTSNYVDPQVFAEECGGALFLLRYLRAWRSSDAITALVGFGLATGTKLPAGIGLGIASVVILMSLVLTRRPGTLIAGGTLAAIVALPWYLRNWLELGNPVWPMNVAVGARELFVGSLLQDGWATLEPIHDLYAWRFWQLAISFDPDHLPLTFGPSIVLIALGGLIGFGVGLTRPDRLRWLVLIGLCVGDLAFLMSPGMNVVRYNWPQVSLRFADSEAGFLAASGAVALSRLSYSPARIGFLLLGMFLVGWDVAWMNTNGLIPLHSLIILGVAVGIAVVAGAVNHLIGVVGRAKLASLTVVAVMVALTATPGLVYLQHYRDVTRYDRYRTVIDLHDIPRESVPGWQLVDRPDQPSTIAFATG